MSGKLLLRSDFKLGPDPRWKVRHTARDNEIAAGWRDGKMVLRVRAANEAPGFKTSHVYVPADVLELTPPVRIRARMRFLGPIGAHSALWIQAIPPYHTPEHTEVDIAEHLGGHIHHWVYWRDEGQPHGEYHEPAPHFVSKIDPTLSRVYQLDWYPDRYEFAVDGIRYKTAEGPSSVPHELIASFLVSDWELPTLDRNGLWKYRTFIDWVEVTRL